jgi:hypothetical protein
MIEGDPLEGRSGPSFSPSWILFGHCFHLAYYLRQVACVLQESTRATNWLRVARRSRQKSGVLTSRAEAPSRHLLLALSRCLDPARSRPLPLT